MLDTVDMPATEPEKAATLELSVTGDPSLTAFVAPASGRARST